MNKFLQSRFGFAGVLIKAAVISMCCIPNRAAGGHLILPNEIAYVIRPGYRPGYQKVLYVFSNNRITAFHDSDSIYSYQDTSYLGEHIRRNWQLLKNTKIAESKGIVLDAGSSELQTLQDTIAFGLPETSDSLRSNEFLGIWLRIEKIDEEFRDGAGERILDSIRFEDIADGAIRAQQKIDSMNMAGVPIAERFYANHKAYCEKLASSRLYYESKYRPGFGRSFKCNQ